MLWCYEKRFYTRATKRGIHISWLAEFPPCFYDWLGWLNYEKDKSFDLPRREGCFDRHLLYYIKCHAICFSIIKSLLCYEWVKSQFELKHVRRIQIMGAWKWTDFLRHPKSITVKDYSFFIESSHFPFSYNFFLHFLDTFNIPVLGLKFQRSFFFFENLNQIIYMILIMFG